MPIKDKARKAETNKEWRLANPNKVKAYQRAWSARNRERLCTRAKVRHTKTRIWLDQLKAAVGCANCGERDPIVLVWHHKVFPRELGATGIGTMMGQSRAHIKEELAKCIVLCANCHARVHAAPRGESASD